MGLVNDSGDYIVTFVRGMQEAQHLLIFMIFCIEEAIPLCKLGEMVWLGRYFSQQWLFIVPLADSIKKFGLIPYSTRGSCNVPADLRTVRFSFILV